MTGLQTMLRGLAAAALAFALSVPAHAATLTGVASVIDGDTLEIHGTRIRLFGIDAPESGQLCTRESGERWRCGQQAALALSDQIGRATITCIGRDTDRYGRLIAVCRSRGVDLNGWMVAQGWALAYRRYSMEYVSAENQAARLRRNIWSGRFDMPWEWRAARRRR